MTVTTARSGRRSIPLNARTGRGLTVCAAAALLIGTCLVAILVHASLYADGANYLLQILDKRGFLFVWWDRSGANLLTQAPVVIGIHLGLHSMQTAVILYSAGTLGIPVLIYLLALFFCRNEWYLPVVSAVIVSIYPATFFMSVSESVCAYSIYLLIAVILASESPLTAGRVVALLLSSAVLPLLYETSVLFGPLLAAWCMYRFTHRQDAVLERVALLVPMVAAATAFMTAAWATLHPIDSEAEQGAGTVSGLWASHEFDAACLVLIGAVGLALAKKRSWIIVAGEAVVLGVAALFTAVGSAAPNTQYTIRLAPIFILLPLFVALWRPQDWRGIQIRSLGVNRRLGYAVVTLVMALTVQNMTLLWGWHDFLSSLQRQVNESHGLIPYSRARLDLAGEYDWTWTFPSMSRILQDSSYDAIVQNPDPKHWQPFNPADGTPHASGLYWRNASPS